MKDDGERWYGFSRWEWWSQSNYSIIDASHYSYNFWHEDSCHNTQFFRFLAVSDERYTIGDDLEGFAYQKTENVTASAYDYLVERFSVEMEGGVDPTALASGVALAGMSALMLAAASVF